MSYFRESRNVREKNGMWIDGRSIPKQCLNCGIQLKNPKAIRCKSCNGKYNNSMKGKFGEQNPNYIHGGINKCIDCNKKINLTYKRCHQCACKHLWTKEDYKLKNNRKREHNANWKGGILELHFAIRQMQEYKKWRSEVFRRDNWKCVQCKDKNIEAHHIKPFRIIFSEFLQLYSQFSPIDDKETLIRLAITYKPFWTIDNGQTLCETCHKSKLMETK